MTRRHLIRLCPLVALALAPAPGQTPRPLDASVTSASRPLSSDELAQVRSWAEHWSAILGRPGVEPAAVESARDELLRPLSALNQPSDLFRGQYARALIDALEPVIAASDAHAAVNAMIVASRLGTDASLELLLRHVHRRDEPRDPIRLRAAIGCRVTIMDATAAPARITLQGRTLNRAVRELSQAASAEPHPVVLRHDLHAISLVDSSEARERLVQAIHNVIDSILANDVAPSPLIEPLYLALAGLRNQFVVALSAAEKRSLGTQLGPCLSRLLDVVHRHWADARASARTAKLYENLVGVCEVFLGVVDGEVRGPSRRPTSNFRGAWADDDPAAFLEDLQRWNAVLSRDPYRPKSP